MITVQRMRRLEVWDALACDSGVRKAMIPRPISVVATAALTGEARLTVTAKIEDADEMSIGRVLRVDEDDTPSYDEWRIVGVQLDSATGIATIIADPVELELGAMGLVEQVDGLSVRRHDIDVVSLTPTEIIDNFILTAPDVADWLSRGTIDVTDPIDVTLSWVSPLAALKQLAELTGTEYQLTRNGTTGYQIDLLDEIGSDAAVADLRASKNMQGLRLNRSTDQQFTRVYPQGAEVDGEHATMGRASWKVTAVSSSTLTLADPDGGDGPIGFDSQLVGAKVRQADGTLSAISASSHDNQTVTVASATGISTGDLIEFRDTSGDELTSLDSPDDVDTYGVLAGTYPLPDLAATVNLLANPVMRDWDSGDALPASWAKVGDATITRETTTTQLGGHSAKCVGTADGDGIETDLAAIGVSDDAPYGSGYASVQVTAGQVRVELDASDGTTTTTYPSGDALATSSETDVWEQLGLAGIDLNAIDATSAKLRIVQHGTTAATFYVDAAQMTNSAGQLEFIEGSGPRRLWQAANERLRLQGGPALTLDAQLMDLARIDPDTWGDDCAIVLGGTVRVTVTRITPAFSTRVVALERDYLVPGNTRLTLSSAPADLAGSLARPKRGRRRAPNARVRIPAPTLVITDRTLQLIGQPILHIEVQPPGTALYGFSRITVKTTISSTTHTQTWETKAGPIEILASYAASYQIVAQSFATSGTPGLFGESVSYTIGSDAVIAQGVILLASDGTHLGFPARSSTDDGLKLHASVTDDGGRNVSDVAAKADNALDSGTSLSEGVTQSDGVEQRVIAKGHIQGTGRNGDAVVFTQEFQSPPSVRLFGGASYEPRSKWNGTGDGSGTSAPTSTAQYDDMAALDLGVSGFTIRARLRQKGTPTQRTDTYPAGTLDAENEDASLSPDHAPAADDTYVVAYNLTLSAGSTPLGPAVSAQCTIAIDLVKDSVTSTVSTKTYTVSGDGSVSQDYDGETQQFTASAVDTDDLISVRVATLTGDTPSVSVDPTSVHYVTTSGDQYASKTPDDDDLVTWEAIAVSD